MTALTYFYVLCAYILRENKTHQDKIETYLRGERNVRLLTSQTFISVLFRLFSHNLVRGPYLK